MGDAARLAARAAALFGASLPWWPAAVLGAQPYRPWLLARRLWALDELLGVDTGLAWVLDIMVIAALAGAVVALLPRRWWPWPARIVGAALLVSGAFLLIVAAVSPLLRPAAGGYIAAAVGLVLLASGLWPGGKPRAARAAGGKRA